MPVAHWRARPPFSSIPRGTGRRARHAHWGRCLVELPTDGSRARLLFIWPANGGSWRHLWASFSTRGLVPRRAHGTSHISSPSGCVATIFPNPCRLRKNASTAGQKRPFITGSIFGSPWRSSCGAIRRQCFSDCDKRRAISASQGYRPWCLRVGAFVWCSVIT